MAALTNDDLDAIQGIVQTTVRPMFDEFGRELEARFETKLNGAVDSLAQQAAAGFAEVHAKLADHDRQFIEIRADLNRIENKLDAIIDRVDDHAARIRQLEAKAA